MRNRLTFYLAAVLGLAGCLGGEVTQPPTTPNTPTSGPQLATPVPNSYCTAKSDTTINEEIDSLYIKNAWPDPNSAQGKFKNIGQLLDAGNVDSARVATKSLVDFVTLKFSQLTPTQQQATQSDFDTLIADLWCFVGISGTVYDLNPGDPAKAFDIPGVGGVLFPPDVVPTGTFVALTDLSGGDCPVNAGPLDCYPGYLDISLYPNNPLSQLATVVLCPPASLTVPVAVGHEASTGFEILPKVDVPPELASTCSTSSSQVQPATWFGNLVQRAADMFLPEKLHASTYMFVGGTGGLVGAFSPFAVVGTDATAGGTGGLVGSFTPPSAGPSATSSNPSEIEGQAGDTLKSGLPTVHIETHGGDAFPAATNGVNPIPGVTVTFTVSPALTLSPYSGAKVCDAQGNVPTSGSISVVTDANGDATLPCVTFGTTTGFANLAATFDASSLNIPGDYQITFNGTTDASLNWLVTTDPGPAAVIQTYMSGVAAPTYSYGTGLTAYTDVSPAPQVLVTDRFGNPVGGQTVYWNATTTNGGVLTLGTNATPTSATGTAQADSWTLGDGLNQATAGIYDASTTPPAGYADALFSGSTPTGISVWACSATPGSKNDLGPMSIDAPNGSIKTVTIQMSVTGQSSAISNYPATLEARLDGPTGTLLGSTAGSVQLPGDNGNPVPVTFVFPTYIGRQTGNHTIWFMLSITTPSQRKPQVWYSNSKFKSNDPCSDARLYAPGSATTYVKGLWINVTN